MSNFVRTVRYNGRELRVRVEEDGPNWRIDAGTGVREASVLKVEPGVYSILLDGQSFEVHAGDLEIGVEDPREPRKSPGQIGLEGRQALTAPMPGKVLRVLVTAGESVKRGQGLVVVEAMKMQNEIKSPKDGHIVSIPVIAGATVAAGETLVVVE